MNRAHNAGSAQCEDAAVFAHAEAAYQVYARYKGDWPMFIGLVRYYRWFFHQWPIQQVFM